MVFLDSPVLSSCLITLCGKILVSNSEALDIVSELRKEREEEEREQKKRKTFELKF